MGTLKLNALTLILYAVYFTTCTTQQLKTVEVGFGRQNAKLSGTGYAISVAFETEHHEEMEYKDNELQPAVVLVKDVKTNFEKQMDVLSTYMGGSLDKTLSNVEVHCIKGDQICDGATDSSQAPPSHPDIRVSHREGGYPYVIGPGGCGDPGAYIYIPYTFLASETGKDNFFGTVDKTLLWLWITYRYGVPPDHGCFGHDWFPEVIEQRKDQEVKMYWNGCVEGNPYAKADFITPGECKLTIKDKSQFIDNKQRCRIRDLSKRDGDPERHVTMPWAEKQPGKGFKCDSKTHQHTYRTPLSILCPTKGQSEVIHDHPDFKVSSDDVLLGRNGVPYVYNAHSKLSLPDDNIYVSVFPDGDSGKMYGVLTYRLMYTASMTILRSRVIGQVKNQKKVELFDDGGAPDAYPHDGYYSGLLPLKGKQSNPVAIQIQVMGSRNQKASVMPSHMTRPGLIPVRDPEGEEKTKHTFCDAEEVKRNDKKNEVYSKNGIPAMNVHEGVCIFFTNSLKNLCEWEFDDDPHCKQSPPNYFKWENSNFHIEHRWCQRLHPKARMLVLRDTVEHKSTLAFFKKNFKGVESKYWLGGERRKFCQYNDKPGTNCAPPDTVTVQIGNQDKTFNTRFRWANPPNDEMPDPFTFNDGKYPWPSDQPNNFAFDKYEGPQNWLTIGTDEAEQFNDWHWQSERLRMACGMKGSHNLFFVSRTNYACNIELLEQHCPRDKPEKLTKEDGQKENRTFACKDIQNDFSDTIDFSINPDQSDFTPPQKPLPPKNIHLEIKGDGKGKGTLTFTEPRGAKYEYELCCSKEFKTESIEEFLEKPTGCQKIKANEETEVLKIANDTSFSCFVRSLDSHGKTSLPSNIVSGKVTGVCLSPSYEKMLDRNTGLSVDPEDPPLPPILFNRDVFLKCSTSTGVLYDGETLMLDDRNKVDCVKQKKARCEEGKEKSLLKEFPADPWCKSKKIGEKCEKECECVESITTIGSSYPKVDCISNKCGASSTDFLPTKDGTKVVHDSCPNPPKISGATLTNGNAGYNSQTNNKADYECNTGKYLNGERAQGENTTLTCKFDDVTGTFSWEPEKLPFCESGLLNQKCENNSYCPEHSICSPDAKKCACLPSFVGNKDNRCVLTRCVVGDAGENGYFEFETSSAEVSIGDKVSFVCFPKHFVHHRAKIVARVTAECKLIDPQDTYPKLYPRIEGLKCEQKKIGGDCQDTEECSLSYPGQSVTCSSGKCSCPTDFKPSKDDYCEPSDDTPSEACEPPNVDSSLTLDPPTPTGNEIKVKCGDGKHLSGEEVSEATLVCVSSHWIVITPVHASSGFSDWKCQDVGHGSPCDPAGSSKCPDGMRCEEISRTCVCVPGKKFDGKACQELSETCEARTFEEIAGVRPEHYPDDPSVTGSCADTNAEGCRVGMGRKYECPAGELFSHFGVRTLLFVCQRHTNEAGTELMSWFHDPKDSVAKSDKCIAAPKEVGSKCDGFSEEIQDSVCQENVPFSKCDSGKCQCRKGTNPDNTQCTALLCPPLSGLSVEIVRKGDLADLGYPYSLGFLGNVQCDKGYVFSGTYLSKFEGISCVFEDESTQDKVIYTDGTKNNTFWKELVMKGNETGPPSSPTCVKSIYCGNTDVICDPKTSLCNDKTANCECLEDYYRPCHTCECVSKYCPDVENLKGSCVRAVVSGSGKTDTTMICRCKKGYRMPNGKYTEKYTCLYNQDVDPSEPHWFNQENKMVKGATFPECQKYLPPVTTYGTCLEVIKLRIGHPVDEDGYPHKYSPLAWATLGWSTGHTLIAICSWAAIAWLVYKWLTSGR